LDKILKINYTLIIYLVGTKNARTFFMLGIYYQRKKINNILSNASSRKVLAKILTGNEMLQIP